MCLSMKVSHASPEMLIDAWQVFCMLDLEYVCMHDHCPLCLPDFARRHSFTLYDLSLLHE